MDKKSFFRGFGVGVLFCSIILGISFSIRTSDSYVKSRAKKLGMVYENKANDKMVVNDEATSSPTASDSAKEATKEPETTNTPEAKASTEPTKEPEETKAPETTKKPEATKAPETTKKPENNKETSKKTSKEINMKEEKEKMEKDIKEVEKSITIKPGDWSSDVSKKLADMGIIDSAVDFDKYLDRNGFSSGISAGTYKVSTDDTYRELAKKITGK